MRFIELALLRGLGAGTVVGMRFRFAAVGLVAALTVTLLPAAAEAASSNTYIWHRCQGDAITWSLAVAPGTRGVNSATEQRLITAALKKVSGASGGAYQFRYVPTSALTIDWGTTGAPIDYEVNAPPYATSPSVDVIFAVVPDAKPGPGKPVSYPFNGAQIPVGMLRRADSYSLADGTQQRYLTRSTIALSSKSWGKVPIAGRQGIYVWGGLSAAGVSGAHAASSVGDRDASVVRDLGKQSCAAVAASPVATLVPPVQLPDLGQ